VNASPSPERQDTPKTDASPQDKRWPVAVRKAFAPSIGREPRGQPRSNRSRLSQAMGARYADPARVVKKRRLGEPSAG
jgi:hypothetical protein